MSEQCVDFILDPNDQELLSWIREKRKGLETNKDALLYCLREYVKLQKDVPQNIVRQYIQDNEQIIPISVFNNTKPITPGPAPELPSLLSSLKKSFGGDSEQGGSGSPTGGFGGGIGSIGP